MPHAGHFICGRDCQFHLATYVGGYIVSTVGEYFPDSQVREIFARSRGVVLEGQGDFREADYMKKVGFREIGLGRKYETMVFKSERTKDKCCPYAQNDGMNVDMDGYNDPGDAFKGHMKMCKKWASKK